MYVLILIVCQGMNCGEPEVLSVHMTMNACIEALEVRAKQSEKGDVTFCLKRPSERT